MAKRLLKSPVPSPAETDVYLVIDRPEVLSSGVFTRHAALVGPTKATDLIEANHLRLTSADQRFLKRFGIRVP